MTKEETMKVMFEGYYENTSTTDAFNDAFNFLCDGSDKKRGILIDAIHEESKRAFIAGFRTAVSLLMGGAY